MTRPSSAFPKTTNEHLHVFPGSSSSDYYPTTSSSTIYQNLRSLFDMTSSSSTSSKIKIPSLDVRRPSHLSANYDYDFTPTFEIPK